MSQIIPYYTIISGSTGVLFALFLAVTLPHNRPKFFLAAFMATFGYTIMYQGFKNLQVFIIPDILISTDDPLPFLFGPLFYLFVLSISTNKKISFLTVVEHCLPFMIYVPILVLTSWSDFLNPAVNHQLIRAISTLAKLISGISYILLSLMVLKQYNIEIKNVYSSLKKVDLSWFSLIIYIQISIWVVVFILYLIAGAGLDIEHLIDPITYTVATIGIYSMFFFWWYQRDIFLSEKEESVPKPVAQIAEEKIDQIKYSKSGLTRDDLDQGYQKLTRIMQTEKPYLDSDLTLKALSELLSLSTHHLSQLINEKMGKNFYDYINEYRVEEIKRELQNPAKQHLTILSIALDCGFNSKSTFNTCFKKYTGCTPSEYKTRTPS